MSIEGRISVDALFHDKDGTTSLKVVSLRSSDEYTTGKVAVITGTCGTSQVLIDVASPYRDASGNTVTFLSFTRFAFSASGSAKCVDTNGPQVWSSGNRVAISDAFGSDDSLAVSSNGGTSFYTIVIYGT